MESSGVKWVRLGDYIEQFRQKCANNKAIVSGVDINKRFIPTRANLDGTDISGYYLVPPTFFACNLMHIGRDERIPIAYNDTDKDLVVTSAYYVFHIKQDKCDEILNEYLYIIFSNKEIDRLTWFYTDSSIRGNLKENRFLDIKMPLPSVAEQQKVVNTWRAFREIKEQNEAKAAPLMQLCQSYIQELKHKYPMQEIGPYLQFFKEKNKDNEIKLEQGINIAKEFITPQRSNSDLSSRIKVRTGQFAYCTQLNNENVAISLRVGPDCVVSPVYEVFEIKKEYKHILNSEYLLLWLIRKEFGRYVYWSSVGSAYEFLRYDNLYSYKIPLPPIEVQQAIVNIYKCANEAKQIAEEADRLSHEVCPALLQHVIHS